MSNLVVRCPKCSKGLKLRDRSKLGKKAKCPKCEHVFVLQAPPELGSDDEDDVEFQLAEPAQPQVGTGARWVPDDAASSGQPAQSNVAVAQPLAVQQPVASQQPGVVSVGQDDFCGMARLKELKKKNAKRRNTAIIAGVLTACAVGGVVYFANTKIDEEKQREALAGQPKIDEELKQKTDDLKQNTELAKASSPTEGEPISLNCLPLGTQILVSIRPAELWADQSRGQEILYCLGPFGTWVEEQLKTLCRFEPAQIEHALIGIIPGPVGEPPQAAAVVRLVADAKKSELIQTFGGQSTEDFGYPVYINNEDGNCYLYKDLRTIVIAPADTAQDVAASTEFASPQADGIEALIPETDQDRHLTLVFQPRAIDAFVRGQAVFPENANDLIRHVLSFFNPDDVDTVAWSMHFGARGFHSDMLLRNTTLMREHQLQDTVRKKLKDLPYDLWHMVEKMDPKVAGPRKIIGRFPAMTQVFAKSTIGGMGTRYAQLTTQLPERAAPNLAIGALLTWDESTRTDFTKEAPIRVPTSTEKIPELIADRLKKKILVEFGSTPLQEAIRYIAEECRCDHYIDGDALKLSGYTKNMPQEFTIEDTGFEALRRILTKERQEDLCLVIQEDKKRFLLTTDAVAAETGLTPYEFK